MSANNGEFQARGPPVITERLFTGPFLHPGPSLPPCSCFLPEKCTQSSSQALRPGDPDLLQALCQPFGSATPTCEGQMPRLELSVCHLALPCDSPVREGLLSLSLCVWESWGWTGKCLA